MKNEDSIIVRKIIKYCSDIGVLLTRFDTDFERYKTDISFQYACNMCIIQIGELANRLSDETKENSQTEKMEMIKFHGWIKSFDDLKGTGLMQTTAFSVSRDTIEKIVKNIPYLAERIQLKNKVRVIADYDPQKKAVVFNHYEIKT